MALNPKGIVFFMAFLPQFINPHAAAAPQLWGFTVNLAIALSAAGLASWFRHNPAWLASVT